MTVRLKLTATGLASKVQLYRIDVNVDNGHWTYDSRAVERLSGKLTEGDRVQLKTLYDDVDWDKEVLNQPVNRYDNVLFELEVHHSDENVKTYQFSDKLHHADWEFKDLFHFLRHNVATDADPLGGPPPDMDGRISAPPPPGH